MEAKKYNNAISTFMGWPFDYSDREDDKIYSAEDLLLVLVDMKIEGWGWKIYTNSRYPKELAIKTEYKGVMPIYIYSSDPQNALYRAVGQALTSPLKQ